MHSGLHRQRSDKNLEKWKSLPLKEKKRQFKDLVDSPYWHLLPSEIQRRIEDLVENQSAKYLKKQHPNLMEKVRFCHLPPQLHSLMEYARKGIESWK